MPTLERALQIAVKSHAGQKDKSGAAYIFHPIRVMMRCTSADAKIAALFIQGTAIANRRRSCLRVSGI